MSISLVNVAEVAQKFPDGTTSVGVRLLFKDEDGRMAMRTAKVSSCAKKVTNDVKSEARYQLLNASKAAARELGKEFGDIDLDDHLFANALRLIAEGAVK